MQRALTVTNNVTVTLDATRTKLVAHVPAGMRGKTLKRLYTKKISSFTIAQQVLQFGIQG